MSCAATAPTPSDADVTPAEKGHAMVDTLQVDSTALRSAAKSLFVISAEFSGADNYADSVGACVGHAGLAGRLRAFTDGWRIRRGEIEAQVWGLAEILQTTVDTFEDIDADLASNVAGGSSATRGRDGGVTP